VTFTPNGQALVAVGQSQDLAEASGDFPSYAPEYIALDGSGTRSRFLSGAIQGFSGHLPIDIHFSSNGKWLAFSTLHRISASCISGEYYALAVDDSTVQELRSPSLETVVGGNPSRVLLPGSYAWSRASDSLAVSASVQNCDVTSPEFGKTIAGPQLSVLGLNGNESLIVPGLFFGPNFDCSGAFLAATHYQNAQDMSPTIEIYAVQTGQMILRLGPGMSPAFQPSPSCVISR